MNCDGLTGPFDDADGEDAAGPGTTVRFRALLAAPVVLVRTTGYVPGVIDAGTVSSALVRLHSCDAAAVEPILAVPVLAPKLTPSTTIAAPALTLLVSILSSRGTIVRLGAAATTPSDRVIDTAPLSVLPLRVNETAWSAHEAIASSTPPAVTLPAVPPGDEPAMAAAASA